MRLDNRIAIVTGAARGIGYAVAERLLAEGARIVLSDIDRTAGAAAPEKLKARGRKLKFVACDVGDAKQVAALVGKAQAFGDGAIDVLVNNAGIVHGADFLTLSEADFDRVLRVNLAGCRMLGYAEPELVGKLFAELCPDAAETIWPEPGIRLPAGGSGPIDAVLQRRDGAAFFHTHALWREQDGALRGGHILPEETCVAVTTTVEAFGLDGAIFEAVRDPETNFKLFEPVAAPPGAGLDAPRRAFALRLRPNEDFAGALEAFCLAQGVTRARIHGGVGSTIGAAFVAEVVLLVALVDAVALELRAHRRDRDGEAVRRRADHA